MDPQQARHAVLQLGMRCPHSATRVLGLPLQSTAVLEPQLLLKEVGCAEVQAGRTIPHAHVSHTVCCSGPRPAAALALLYLERCRDDTRRSRVRGAMTLLKHACVSVLEPPLTVPSAKAYLSSQAKGSHARHARSGQMGICVSAIPLTPC